MSGLLRAALLQTAGVLHRASQLMSVVLTWSVQHSVTHEHTVLLKSYRMWYLTFMLHTIVRNSYLSLSKLSFMLSVLRC